MQLPKNWISYLVFQIQNVKNVVFQNFWLEIPNILTEIRGFRSKY